MNIWHDFNEERIKEDDFIACIEISKGSKKKYELDKESGLLILDRVLNTSMQYPSNYGFIPKTLSEDGDPLDVLVLCTENITPLTIVRCYPIAVVEMLDHGKRDEKIVAIPFEDPFYNEYKGLKELPNNVAREIEHFFSVYKGANTDVTSVKPIRGKEEAKKAIREAIELYKQTFSNKK